MKRLKIPFCLSQEYIQIGDKCRGKDASFDFLTEQQFNRAILLNTLSLKAADPELFLDLAIQPTNEAEQQLLADNLDMIFNLFNAGNYDGLAKYMQLLPDTGDITPQCTNLAIAAFDESKQRECILGQVLDQTRQFLNTLPGHQPTLAGKNRKLLNTMINYKTYLQQSQISEILGIVQNQQFTIYTIADNLKKEFDKSLGERFQGIKTYFSQVEGFNKEIARADIGYIKGTLDIYQEQVNVLAPEVGQGYVDLLNYALATASLQLAQTTVNLALQIYDACNPLKTLFGGGAAVDVLAALDEVAQAISQLADAGSLLAAWDNLKRETNSIVTKLAENTRFLETVKAILDQIDASETSSETFEKLKQEFLAEYNNYSPKVTKPELTAMTALWEKVIERACGVIEAADKTTSVAVQTYVNSQGYCWKIPIKMQRLTETYEEIYDFQFDLMDAMAAYVRASTAVTSAGDMNENYEMIAQSNPDNILYFLQQLAALTYLSNKMEKAQVVENYCDVLQYKQGGQRPAVCSGESTDIPTLIAYEGTGCTADLTYQNVPIEPSSESDRAFLNLTELFLGNPVTFQIPNGQWLVSHGWINEEEVNNAYFLNKFEVYLPTESQRPRRINVVAKVTGGNKLAATSSTEYLITPPRPLEYTYSEGRGVVCRQKTITNPYRLCESDAPSDICPQTAQDDECEERPVTALDASVYAQWSIRLSGYPSKRAIPDPATPVSVRVGVGLCKVSSSRKKNKAVFRDSKKSKKKYGRGKHVSDDTKKTKNTRGRNKKHWSKHMMRDVSCCGDGLYWSASDSSCQPCPDDSVRRLHGYYCDKNTNTM